MTIKVKTVRALPQITDINLKVTQSGMTITVGAGDFRSNGRDLALSESQEFDAETLPHKCTVVAYLMRNEKTGAVFVMVDEFNHDGLDVPINIELIPDTEILWRVFTATIPANSTSLDDVEIRCKRTVPTIIKRDRVKPDQEEKEIARG